ncbi:hypothetical protein B0H17DRAFT_987853 [Mycena rosella]|uniref:Golgi apparatus membrane protein TVP38 n=1 Tax=Mycena rosella TaxID=1033263 RepID=A0AAD7GAD1_MYCRO|nr:hypothetical protein B0H17DRAFT_987853 [Mycena rosella]
MSTVPVMPQPTYALEQPVSNMYNYPPSGATDTSRDMLRTPSPTPSEKGEKKRTLRERMRIYAVLAIIIVVIALVETYHEQIINALQPATNWLHDAPAGWLIPIVILIALSFPPLFGHEIVAMLCGVAWGLGPGFGIVAAGTLLGEICTFFTFKIFCHARGEKMELTNIGYGSLSHVVREGGLLIAIVIRYSAMPPHFSTAVFATCGMPFWVFLTAAILSLPKQLIVVYIGVALKSNDSTSKKVQRIVLAVSIVITVLIMGYVRRLMTQARPAVVYARRKARQAKLQGTA